MPQAKICRVVLRDKIGKVVTNWLRSRLLRKKKIKKCLVVRHPQSNLRVGFDKKKGPIFAKCFIEKNPYFLLQGRFREKSYFLRQGRFREKRYFVL